MVAPIEPASYLPLIEPLLGAAFGINVAYFNLERFRYRKIVRAEARRQYRAINDMIGDVRQAAERITALSQFKKIQALATLRDDDPLGESDSEYEQHGIADLDSRDAKKHRGWWYFFCFSYHQDMLLSKILTWVMALMLLMCVNHSFGSMQYFAFLFNSPSKISYWSYFVFLSLSIPLFAILAGNRMVASLSKYSKEAFNELGKLLDTVQADDVNDMIRTLQGLSDEKKQEILRAISANGNGPTSSVGPSITTV